LSIEQESLQNLKRSLFEGFWQTGTHGGGVVCGDPAKQ